MRSGAQYGEFDPDCNLTPSYREGSFRARRQPRLNDRRVTLQIGLLVDMQPDVSDLHLRQNVGRDGVPKRSSRQLEILLDESKPSHSPGCGLAVSEPLRPVARQTSAAYVPTIGLRLAGAFPLAKAGLDPRRSDFGAHSDIDLPTGRGRTPTVNCSPGDPAQSHQPNERVAVGGTRANLRVRKHHRALKKRNQAPR
jgi:acetylornithine deacetylase/succinyl-diaminopimelate desuccinylase-like protein